jgi:hypothetical protein
MGNTLLTPSIIAKEALMQLQANLVMAELVHKDYSSEFAKVGDTITIRKPATFKAKNFAGQIEKQDITESSVSVKLDRIRDVSVDVSSKEWTLDIKDFSEQVIKPAMQAIAQQVDEDLLAYGVEHAGKKVTATASPTNLADIASIGKELDLAKAPTSERRLVLHPTHKYRYALTENLSKVSYAGDNETLRNALLGSVYGIDTYMDQNAPDTGASTTGTATSYKVAGTKGATKVALSSVSATTATIAKGDGFIFNGHLYRFTEDATAVDGAVAEIDIDQKLADKIEATDTIVMVNAPHSLAFHKNGLALVSRQLELPMGAANAAIESFGGLSIRVVYGYDIDTKTDTISFDILYGVKELDKDLIVDLA